MAPEKGDQGGLSEEVTFTWNLQDQKRQAGRGAGREPGRGTGTVARSQGRPGVGVGCTRGVQAKQGERIYLRSAGQGVMSSPVDSCRSALLLMRRERKGVRGVRKKRDVTVALKGERTLVTLGGRGGDRAKWRELE